ncbi:MAG: hypothetical protein PHI23_02730 [Candidatus Peribacteraceae bacterium]|nr:hypothetical protein [Candidatus Peribacteraceae bacterium]
MLLRGGLARLDENRVIVTVKTAESPAEFQEVLRQEGIQDVSASQEGNPSDGVVEVIVDAKGVTMRRARETLGGRDLREIDTQAKAIVEACRRHGAQVLQN